MKKFSKNKCPDCGSKSIIKTNRKPYDQYILKCRKCRTSWDTNTRYCNKCLDVAMYGIFGKGSAKINKICTREELEAVYTILNMVNTIDATQRYMERLLQCGAPHDDKDVIYCIERLKGFEEYRKKIPFTNEKLNTMEKLTENCRSSRMKSFLEDFLRSPWRDKGDIYRRGRRLRGAGFS